MTFNYKNLISMDFLNDGTKERSEELGCEIRNMLDFDTIEYENPIKDHDSPLDSKSELESSKQLELPTHDAEIESEEIPLGINPIFNREEDKFDGISDSLENNETINYCKEHHQKIAYQNRTTKKYLCQSCANACESKEDIESLQPKIQKQISDFGQNLDKTLKNLKSLNTIDVAIWKGNILENLEGYFKTIDRNMGLLKKQAIQEVQEMFNHETILKMINKKKFIDDLCNEISAHFRRYQHDFHKLQHATYVQREQQIDLLQKSIEFCQIEVRQYQSIIGKKEHQLSALIAQVKAMTLKIEDALIATVFKKIQRVERTNFDFLFQMMEIDKSAHEKINLTPFYCFHKEFIKGKNCSPIDGIFIAFKIWNRYPQDKRNIFVDIATKRNANYQDQETPQSQRGASLKEKDGVDGCQNISRKMTSPLNLGLINRRDRTDNPLGEQQDSKRMSNLKLNENIIPMKKFDPVPDINRTNPRRIVNKMPPPLFPIPPIPPLNRQMHKAPEKTDSRRRKSQFDLLKGAPGNLKIIEKRILQKELEKKLDPSISSQLKSLQEINLKKREEKYQIKKKIEEERANKYQKSQLSRIHRIMKTINKE